MINYWGLILIDQFLTLIDSFIEDLIRQQIDINDMQFGLKYTTSVIVILRRINRKYLAKQDFDYIFVESICRFKKTISLRSFECLSGL